MIDLRNAKKIVVLGGGTAGWFAAITLRRLFSPKVEIRVIESSSISIVGVGEGGLLNLQAALVRNNINLKDFMQETSATYKWGFSYEGWRTGGRDDRFFHPFASSKASASQWYENGMFPLFAAMISQGVPVSSYVRGLELVVNNASQEEATNAIKENTTDLITSYHFDSYKVANFLKKVALSRGVTYQDNIVREVLINENGYAYQLKTDEELIDFDFLLDASGLSRKVIGNTLNGKWQSFKDYLLMDCAIPFHMPHPLKNPMLVTRAITMNAGWMWQIPLTHRVGAGYVFSSKHITEDQALAELEQKLGFPVEPQQKTLKFEPGCFEEVWIGNVMALGLSSGFVEPLEATSIGQMLEQLRNFERVLVHSQGLISGNTIRDFNRANLQSWLGIRDFLRMHYDCPRNDTQLWKDISVSAMPDEYKEFKACIRQRMPRMIDIENYAMHGWGGIFHIINWMFVAAPLGLVSPQAAAMELKALPKASAPRRSGPGFLNK